MNNKIKNLLEKVYAKSDARLVCDYIENLSQKYTKGEKNEKTFSENDVMLITYGDSIHTKNQSPLQTLHNFLQSFASDFSAVHILPFYPYTSDDGFSVVDYLEVDSNLGSWQDVKEIAKHYDMMYDGVINHMSKSSKWFKGFLEGDKTYSTYFVAFDEDVDVKSVVRPRTHPLLTAFEVNGTTKYVWTTFSDDQIDLNFKSPQLLIEIINVLLTYAEYGAKYIRLDAIGFMWKELGTSCIHLENTHNIIKLFKCIFDEYFPNVKLVTETNVPHKENISYFGNYGDEAQMVYQFPLPPLMLYTMLSGNSTHISNWLKSVSLDSKEVTFFNFLASHDGVGVRPVEGILNDDEITLMLDKVIEHEGLISYKTNTDGTKSPYELNISYMNAIVSPKAQNETKVAAMTAVHAILVSLQGVPGIYINSLIGCENYVDGVKESGINRRINREKHDFGLLKEKLESDTLQATVQKNISALIAARKKCAYLSPLAKQEVLDYGRSTVAFKRYYDSARFLISVTNITNAEVQIDIGSDGVNIITGKNVSAQTVLKPYEYMWVEVQ